LKNIKVIKFETQVVPNMKSFAMHHLNRLQLSFQMDLPQIRTLAQFRMLEKENFEINNLVVDGLAKWVKSECMCR